MLAPKTGDLWAMWPLWTSRWETSFPEEEMPHLSAQKMDGPFFWLSRVLRGRNCWQRLTERSRDGSVLRTMGCGRQSETQHSRLGTFLTGLLSHQPHHILWITCSLATAIVGPDTGTHSKLRDRDV